MLLHSCAGCVYKKPVSVFLQLLLVSLAGINILDTFFHPVSIPPLWFYYLIFEI